VDAGNSKYYEERIAALEEKIGQFQAQMEREARQRSAFSLKNWLERYGLLVAWGLLILLIGAFKPEAMFSWNSYAVMFGSQAMLVVLSLAFIIPLTAGDFDLSIAGTMALSSMLVARPRFLGVGFQYHRRRLDGADQCGHPVEDRRHTAELLLCGGAGGGDLVRFRIHQRRAAAAVCRPWP